MTKKAEGNGEALWQTLGGASIACMIFFTPKLVIWYMTLDIVREDGVTLFRYDLMKLENQHYNSI